MLLLNPPPHPMVQPHPIRIPSGHQTHRRTRRDSNRRRTPNLGIHPVTANAADGRTRAPPGRRGTRAGTMSKWNLDPEVVYITGGSIEIHRLDRTPVHREPDGTVTYGDPLHVQANVRVYLHS